MELALVVAASLFAVLNGVNDGGTIVSMGLKIPSLRPAGALLLLSAAVVAAPVILGTTVASTLAEGLVAFEGDTGRVALLLAVVAATVVTTVLARLSLPTSLTLALVGGIVGAGWATGLPVSRGTVGFVLAMAAVAPLAGAALAFWLSRWSRRWSAPGGAHRWIGRLHQLAFGLQCLAYGGNDGQKMLALFLVTAGPLTGPTRLMVLAAVGVLFLGGSVVGVRRFSGTMASGVVPSRPANAVAAEFSAATAVLVSAGLGAPVSMTQALAGGLVGSGVSAGYRRVRWRIALQIATAWILTLPTAFVLAAATGALAAVLGSLRG